MTRQDIIFAVDDHHRWYVFDRRNALGGFDTWDDAAKLRDKLVTHATEDDAAPAWTPKSGGY